MAFHEKELFENYIKSKDFEFQMLPQSGSDRKNFIATFQSKKYIITSNANISENESFLYFSKVFSELNLNTPKIFSVSKDRTSYIQEFVGQETLSEIISKEGITKRTTQLVQQCLLKLFQLQKATDGKIDYHQTFEYENYDEIPITHDLFYFKFMFADIVEAKYHKTKLIKEFQNLVSYMKTLSPRGIMIRDFQSRNIMVNEDDDVFFIDYQSAMKGPLMYDVVSFLYQAKANFPENFRAEMLNYYYQLWEDPKTIASLQESLKPLQFIRFLQVLGAYGFRGLVQRKPHFIKSIEQGIENLYQLSENWDQMKNFPELKKCIDQFRTEHTKNSISNYIKTT